jgi:hypothetical protein
VSLNTYSQINSVDELTVKNSGEYFWEELSGTDEMKIKESLSNTLWSQEKVQLLQKSNPIIKKSDIGYIIKPRGPKKYLIIAYLYKNSASNKTIENSPNKEIETEHQIVVQSKEIPKTEPIQDSIKQSNFTKQNTLPVVSSGYEKNTQEYDIKLTPLQSDQNKDLTNLPNASDFIKSIVGKEKCIEVMPLLEKEKKKGKVFYDTREEVFDKGIESCYIMICDKETGNLVYLLPPGNENRFNAKTGIKIDLNEINNNSKLKKLYIYEYK